MDDRPEVVSRGEWFAAPPGPEPGGLRVRDGLGQVRT